MDARSARHLGLILVLASSTAGASEAQDRFVKAAAMGQLALMKRALKGGATIDGKTEHGITALILAAYAGQTASVKLLLALRADPNVVNDDGEPALISAAAHKNADAIVPLLLKAGARHDLKDKNGRTALIFHAQEGHLAAVRALVEKGADLSVAGHDDGVTALMVAASNGHAPVVELLLSRGTDWKPKMKKGFSALGLAANNDHTALFATFKAGKVPIDSDASPIGPALLAAVAYGQLETARALVDAGANVQQQTESGVMPLHLACYAGYLNIAKLLVERGANIDALNKLKSTPIRAAAHGGHAHVVRWLLAKGADPSVVDMYGKLPIDYAREKGADEIVKLLESAR